MKAAGKLSHEFAGGVLCDFASNRKGWLLWLTLSSRQSLSLNTRIIWSYLLPVGQKNFDDENGRVSNALKNTTHFSALILGTSLFL